jgi:hypothetical protein
VEAGLVYHIAGGNQEHREHFTHWFKELDGNPALVDLEDKTQDEGGLVTGTWGVGRPLKADHMPTRLLRGGPGPKQSPILDVDSLYGGALLVSKAFKDILEELEPGVHRYFPMTVYVKNHDPATWQPEDGYYEDPKGKKIKLVKLANYLLLNICNRLDTYHPDTIGRNERGFYKPEKLGVEGRQVFSLEKIGNHHAWHDKFAHGRFISDAFAERLKASGLTGLYFQHLDQA